MKVLLVGYNGARNTGSDVRVAAIAQQLRQLFGKNHVQITVMTLDSASLEGYFDDDVVLQPFRSLFPMDLYRACCSHHAAVLCEGSTLKSTFANALTLFLCEAAGIMARQGKPCIAYGAEVGAMEPFLQRAAVRFCRDTWFVTRTEGSLEALKKLGLQGHAGTDAAWSWKPLREITDEEMEHCLREQGWDGEKPLLGIAVINPFCWPVRASLKKWLKGMITGDLSGQYDQWYFFSDSPARRRAYARYIRQVAGAVRKFLRRHDCFPVLLGMERLDEDACRDLAGRLGCPAAAFLSGDCPAEMMTGVLRKLSLLVTSRYHAAVLSMKRGCPIIAVSMDERLDGIMKEMDEQDRYLMHVTDRDLGKKVFKAMEEGCRNEESLRRRIQEKEEAAGRKLTEMGGFMKKYLESGVRSGNGRGRRRYFA